MKTIVGCMKIKLTEGGGVDAQIHVGQSDHRCCG